MFSLLREFLEFARSQRKLWLVPLLFILLAVGGLLILAEGSALAPFIYSLF
ncbi:MAG TPA: DUF5989 family protein [Thermoanaerobaculia bacterium]|nr:DUF5989 family protein [Thermoanaerobaculia bacterium]